MKISKLNEIQGVLVTAGRTDLANILVTAKGKKKKGRSRTTDKAVEKLWEAIEKDSGIGNLDVFDTHRITKIENLIQELLDDASDSVK